METFYFVIHLFQKTNLHTTHTLPIKITNNHLPLPLHLFFSVLIGLDYLWKVVTLCPDDIAARAIELLREVSTNLGPRLLATQLEFHESYITECYDRLRAHFDTAAIFQKTKLETDKEFDLNQLQNTITCECVKMCRILRVLHEYLSECDNAFVGERKVIPLYRACKGKHMTLIIRFSNPNRPVDDLEVVTHSNDTLVSIRRAILRRIKPLVQYKLELFINGEALDTGDDRKLLSQIPIRDRMVSHKHVLLLGIGSARRVESIDIVF